MVKYRVMFMSLLLFGCVSTPSASDKMASWNGADVDRLVAVWGKPTQVTSGSHGETSYIYQLTSTRMFLMGHGSPRTERYEREDVVTTLSFDVQGRQVTGYQMDGNYVQNADAIRANPNSAVAH